MKWMNPEYNIKLLCLQLAIDAMKTNAFTVKFAKNQGIETL
jgi:hypothetical protein